MALADDRYRPELDTPGTRGTVDPLAGCLIAPHCLDLPAALLDARGQVVWLHVGPIARDRTLVAAHTRRLHHRTPPPPISRHIPSGDGDLRRALIRSLPTWPEHRGYGGYSLALVTMTARPAAPCRALTLQTAGLAPVLYVVAGAAWKRQDGPYAELAGHYTNGKPNVVYHFAGEAATTALLAELNRAHDLLLGRHAPIGRPSLAETGAWRALAERAEQLRADHPDLPYTAIADILGVDERTLRTYRRLLERERARSSLFGPTLLSGG